MMTMNRKIIPLIVIIACVGGVLLVVSGGESGQSPNINTNSEGGEAPRVAQITVDPGSYNATMGRLNVSVEMTARGYGNLSYRNPQLCMYDENGTLLHSERMRDFRVPDSGELVTDETITANVTTLPKYILVDHPGFRSDDRVYAQARIWDSEREVYIDEELGSNQSTGAYPLTDQAGQCG